MASWIFEQTEIFEKNFKKLIPKQIQKEFNLQIKKLLSKNPFSGKPLGFPFFREKKIKKWRIYFLIYESYLVLYFINVRDKKLQQNTINIIKSNLDLFKYQIDKKYDKFRKV